MSGSIRLNHPAVVRILLCLVVIIGGAFASVVESNASSSTPILGLLGAGPVNYQSDHQAGVQAVTVQVGWDQAEPSANVYSTAYMDQQGQFPGPITEVNEALAAGLKVIIDPGLQYPPQWVINLPNAEFVNQFGSTFTGANGSGNQVVNAITNMTVRSAEQAYLAWLGQQFAPGTISGVREGGGPLDELRYPQPVDGNGTYDDSYWAYDADTQATLPPSVRGWVPGSGTSAQAAAFLAAYNQNLDSFGEWLNGQLFQDFSTKVLVLLPGWGERPGVASLLESQLLEPPTTATYPEFNEGLDWIDLLDNLPDPSESVAVTTYLDATANQGGPAPADYLSTLISGTPLLLGGENTGNGTVATLSYCASQARSLNFWILQWMDQSQLGSSDGDAGSPPSLDQLGDVFATGGLAALSPVSVATSVLPVATQHLEYSASLAASSSVPITAWSLVAGNLPSGLNLNGMTGVISGVPESSAGTSFTVSVTNSSGSTASAGFSLSVVPGPLQLHLIAPVVGVAATPDGGGYWVASADGGVAAFGNAAYFGSMVGMPLNSPVSHIVATPDGLGYWLVATDGGTFTFGDAKFFGSMGGQKLNAAVVDLAPTRDGQGYWLVASDGGVFAFGDARFCGSMGGRKLNQPVIGITADAATGGYWLVASDGGIFSFDAPFFGSAGALRLNRPINGMTAEATDTGYWFVASDGGIFSFGQARFSGSTGGIHLNSPVVGMATDPATGGYWLVASDGGIFSFDAPFFGAA